MPQSNVERGHRFRDGEHPYQTICSDRESKCIIPPAACRLPDTHKRGSLVPKLRQRSAVGRGSEGLRALKGDYVMLEDEDLKKLPIPSKDSIDVSSFCTVSEVDPIYFEKHYYLEPEKNGKRPFDLFR